MRGPGPEVTGFTWGLLGDPLGAAGGGEAELDP